MAILENRVKSTSGTIAEFTGFMLVALRSILVVVFIILCLNLLYGTGSKKVKDVASEYSGSFINVAFSVFDSIFDQISYMSSKFYYLQNLAAENIELKLELARLKGLQEQLKTAQVENASLKKLLKTVPDIKRGYITARLLSVSSTPFSRIATISAGEKQGAAVDQVVACNQGLIGRIVEVSANYSKVMLVNDPNSRIPVISAVSRERGILAGNGINTGILYLPNEHNITEGETIETSGDGAIYPAGLPIAKVIKVSREKVAVKPLADLSKTDFVIVYMGSD